MNTVGGRCRAGWGASGDGSNGTKAQGMEMEGKWQWLRRVITYSYMATQRCQLYTLPAKHLAVTGDARLGEYTSHAKVCGGRECETASRVLLKASIIGRQ